jgi:hypothetical protein
LLKSPGKGKGFVMQVRFRYLAAAGAVAAVVAAPIATADDSDQSCTAAGPDTQCSSPGNVEINDSPPAVPDAGFGGGFYPGPYPVPFNEGD